MKKFIVLAAAFLIFSSHDMFLKMGTYFLQPNTPSTIKLFNGTFDKSENVIDRSRMNDVRLIGNGIESNPDSSQWSEMNDITILNFTTGESGTWVAGVSTNPSNIELSAEDFNAYLVHDGVLDMLSWREENNALDQSAVEKYSKHVKTIFQVGEKTTDDWQTVLGYPIEFVPLANPYALHAGDKLQVKLLRDGAPLVDQLVYMGSEGHEHEHDHDHDHEAEGHSHDATELRTDGEGLVTMNLDAEGQWYLRTIHMEQIEEEGLTHESNWATLTFEVGHGHSHGDGAAHNHEDGHEHNDEKEKGSISFLYILLGAVLLGFILFRLRKK